MRVARSRRRVAWPPRPVSTSIAVVSRLTACLRSIQRASFHVTTGSSAMLTSVSPSARPATAAGVFGGGLPTIGFTPGTPATNSTQ